MSRTRFPQLLPLSSLVALLLPIAAAAVPIQVPYSGQLSENGQLVNGTRSMAFVIYDAATGGNALYTQAEATVMVANGVYHVELNAPSTVWTGADRWLGVSVNGGPELTPRTKVGSVPYAIRAAVADSAVSVALVSEAWQLPILQNGWQNYGSSFAPARFFKDATGIVHIQGLIRNGLLGSAAFTLPTGYRPGAGLIFATISNQNTVARVDVAADGRVIPEAGNTSWLTISGVSFRTGN